MKTHTLVISRLYLDPKSPKVQNDLLDRYCLFSSLKSAFKNYDCREKVSMLYRIDKTTNQKLEGIPILVQSLVTPKWDEFSFPIDYFLIEPFIKEIDNVNIKNDSTYRFLLHASPARLSKEYKVVRLYNDQLLRWIIKIGIQNGFYVERNEIKIHQLPPMNAIKKDKGGRNISINIVEYSGLLHIINKDLFTNAIINGLGRGLEFGCGLLTIAS